MIKVKGPLEDAVAEASEKGGALWRPVVEVRCTSTCGRQIGLVGSCGPQWPWQWLSLVPSEDDRYFKSLQPHATVRDETGHRRPAPPIGLLPVAEFVYLPEAPRALRAYCADSCHRIQRFGLVRVVRALREALETGRPVKIGPTSTT